jgi:3-dehydroquinate synthase
MSVQRFHVRAGAHHYDVVCGSGALRRVIPEISGLGEFSSVHVLSSPRVWRATGKQIRKHIGPNGGPNGANRLHLFDDAETKKTMRSVESICRALVRTGADRRALLVAVGGGVVGDVAGFVAASYLRGVQVVHIPTTLVAQVDSAIGGKTGVNLPEGKNLVGAFYPPALVIADPDLLRTLPDREYRSALAEVIKYGVISDVDVFSFLEREFERVLKRDAEAVERIMAACVKIKAHVVSRDEREGGLREILNYGHTFAHALETATRYRRFRHGEAVAWGMVAAALLGREAAITPTEDAARIIALVRRMGRITPWPSNVAAAKLIALMRADKKARGGKIRFVLAPYIGKVRTYDNIPEQLVERALRLAPTALSVRAAVAGQDRAANVLRSVSLPFNEVLLSARGRRG